MFLMGGFLEELGEFKGVIAEKHVVPRLQAGDTGALGPVMDKLIRGLDEDAVENFVTVTSFTVVISSFILNMLPLSCYVLLLFMHIFHPLTHLSYLVCSVLCRFN